MNVSWAWQQRAKGHGGILRGPTAPPRRSRALPPARARSEDPGREAGTEMGLWPCLPLPQQCCCQGGHPALQLPLLCLGAVFNPFLSEVGPSSCFPRHFVIPSCRMCFFSHFTQVWVRKALVKPEQRGAGGSDAALCPHPVPCKCSPLPIKEKNSAAGMCCTNSQ